MPFRETRSPRVYVPVKSTHNFDDAKQYGQLTYLTQGTLNKLALVELYRVIAAALAGAEPDDYLMLAGPTTVNVVAASILSHRFGRINYLVFDGYTQKYVSRPIVIDNLEVENARTRESVQSPSGAGGGRPSDRGS